ncbi:MAG: 3-deoxy-manno-octulosonate cytidylyltransferase [Pseudomonadota bacterium]|nr:3-deoxy-manno-octulosonate cytidylyltransferase [Pseudomonadota bacterium]
MTAVAVIPARLDSSRFPRKVLAEVAGKPLIQWVYEHARQASLIDRVIIATDSREVEAACRAFTDDIHLSTLPHACGSDRVGEAIRDIDCDIVANVQADQPLMDPRLLDALTDLFSDPGVEIATAVTPIHAMSHFLDPNIVKVVRGSDDEALYFSRAPIPWHRDSPPSPISPFPEGFEAWEHVGVYLFRKPALEAFAGVAPTALEQTESLEQLRALETGQKIRVLEWNYEGFEIDTPADLERLRGVMESRRDD